MTQKDVATSIRCTMKSYRRWEKGNELPSTTHLLALADFYKVDCDYLLGRMNEKTHDLAFICEKTGLSERTVSSIMTEPAIAEALNSLDHHELIAFSDALNNAIAQIVEAVSMLERDDPEEQWLFGIRRQNMELSALRFREKCGELINKWCDLESLISAMRQKETEYQRVLADAEAKQKKEREEAAKRPPLTAEEKEELFQKWRQMIDRTEADNG